MNRWEDLGSATLIDGDVMTLHRRGDAAEGRLPEYSLRVANVELMNSRQHGSEEQLAALALARVQRLERASVLVGGLGMGFTLRAALDLLPATARVTVAELVPEVVEWHTDHLGVLAGQPLSDERVSVVLGDVGDLLRASNAAYDVILLDTDNGPEGTTQEGNERLYDAAGLKTIRTALAPGGVLAVWSVFPSEPFTRRLRKAGFTVDVKHVRSRGKKGNRHVIWVATPATGRNPAGGRAPTLGRA